MRGLRASDIRRIAAMQDLRTLDRRERVLRACAATDAQALARDTSDSALAASLAELDRVFAAPGLDLDALSLAAAQFALCDEALTQAEVRLSDARNAEATANAEWSRASLVADWFTGEGLRLERRERQMREEKRLADALALRLFSDAVGETP